MFMSHNDNDEIDTLFTPSKKTSKKPAKAAKKDTGKAAKKPLKSVKKTLTAFAERVKKAKEEIAKGSQAKAKKASTKKVSKPKNAKPKAYKVSGSFTVDAEGLVLKHTKSIDAISVDKNSITLTITLKRK